MQTPLLIADSSYIAHGSHAVFRSAIAQGMDFEGQKLAEQLGLWIITAAAAIAFVLGWSLHSFGLMAKVRCSHGRAALPMQTGTQLLQPAGVWGRLCGSFSPVHPRLAALQSAPAPVAAATQRCKRRRQQQTQTVLAGTSLPCATQSYG